MNNRTTFTIVRHGETEANRVLRIQGHGDAPLSAEGMRQAQERSTILRMNILGISGSPRVKHTALMLKTVLDATGAEYELVHLKDYTIRPCLNCKFCHKAFACAQKDDIHILHKKLVEADVIVFGSPTHFSNVSGIMKNFMDRCLPFYFSRQLEGKRVVILTVGGYGSLIERDEMGNCVDCVSDDACVRAVSRCLDSMRFFADHLGMNVVGELYAIHGDPSAREKELVELGERLKKLS